VGQASVCKGPPSVHAKKLIYVHVEFEARLIRVMPRFPFRRKRGLGVRARIPRFITEGARCSGVYEYL